MELIVCNLGNFMDGEMYLDLSNYELFYDNILFVDAPESWVEITSFLFSNNFIYPKLSM